MRNLVFISILLIIGCKSKQPNNSKPEITSPDSTIKTYNSLNKSDSDIIGERIDGPANIRDAINGKLMFSLNDNFLVAATYPKNDWLQVGLIIDISKNEMDSLRIVKGSKIFADGKEAGVAIENIDLQSAFRTNEGLKGELVGFTSIFNIRPNNCRKYSFSYT